MTNAQQLAHTNTFLQFHSVILNEYNDIYNLICTCHADHLQAVSEIIT